MNTAISGWSDNGRRCSTTVRTPRLIYLSRRFREARRSIRRERFASTKPEELEAVLREGLAYDGVAIMDIVVSKERTYFRSCRRAANPGT